MNVSLRAVYWGFSFITNILIDLPSPSHDSFKILFDAFTLNKSSISTLSLFKCSYNRQNIHEMLFKND